MHVDIDNTEVQPSYLQNIDKSRPQVLKVRIEDVVEFILAPRNKKYTSNTFLLVPKHDNLFLD